MAVRVARSPSVNPRHSGFRTDASIHAWLFLRMRASLPLSAAIVAAFAALPAPAVAADCSGSPPDAEIVCLINEQRSAAGLESLALAPGVSVVASQYAQRMAVEGFFAHVSPEGRTVADRLAGAGGHPKFRGGGPLLGG